MDLHRQTSHEHHEHYNLPHGYPLKPLGHNVESNVRGFINCQVGFTVIRESTFEGSTFKESGSTGGCVCACIISVAILVQGVSFDT